MGMSNSGSDNDARRRISWSLVVAANSEEILRSNLLRTGETGTAKEIFVHWQGESAAKAFNAELVRCSSDVVVFAHQDVFLPKGWATKMMESIELLSEHDPKWAVAGCFGITYSGKCAGTVYSSGLKRFVGVFSREPVQVQSLDEVLLILNRKSHLQFDVRLPGFHLYGTAICLAAEEAGMKSYAIPLIIFHNSRGINWLPLSFWKSYVYVRHRWKHRLPVVAPCTKITYGGLPIVQDIIRSAWASATGKDKVGKRVLDPEEFYNEFIRDKVAELYGGVEGVTCDRAGFP